MLIVTHMHVLVSRKVM